MRRNHYAPVTMATYVDAILTDAADDLSFAESLDTGESFGFFTRTAPAPAPAPVSNRNRGRVAAAVLSAVAILAPAAAHADPVEDQPGGAYVSRVSQYPVGPGITVTLSNSSGEKVRTDVLRPCVYEDGRHCYWQADHRGNGIGRDYVVMSGTVFVFDLSWMGEGR